MFKRILYIGMVCLSGSLALAAGGDMGGAAADGSAASPYLIEDIDDFNAFTGNAAYHAVGIHTKLTVNLDLSGIAYTSGSPIGGFDGVFDGGNHTLSGLSVSGSQQCGLFSTVGGTTTHLAVVKNLILDGAEIVSDSSHAGALAGWLQAYSVIEDCHVINSSVTGLSYAIGGLCGQAGLGGSNPVTVTISDCSASDTQVSGGSTLGGLIGWSLAVDMDRCYAHCMVECSGNNAGGLVGYFQSDAENCFADSTVNGLDFVGGLIGYNFLGRVVNCYATGKVTVAPNVGGLCGLAVTGSGYEDTANFWDTQTTQVSASAMGSPATTVDMMTLSTFSNAGWDFTSDWMMLREGEDYPRLRWQRVVSGDIAGLYGVDMADAAYMARYWMLDDCGGTDDCGRADIDGDGMVALTDLEEITRTWLMSRPDYRGDIAGLYGVNMADLAYLSRFWLLDGCTGADDCGRADIDGSGDVGMTDLEAIINDWLMR